MSRIVVVDDDNDILKYCEAILGARGHELVTTSSPQHALNLLKNHNADLLILDVVMPEMSGFDLLNEVLKLEHLKAQVLMLTGRRSPEDVRRALSLGATDYMVKPLDRDVLLAKVESILGLHAPAPEVRFAEGSTQSSGEVTLPVHVVKITEMGMTIKTLHYIDRHTKIKLASEIFSEIGITAPPLRAAHCKAIDNDDEYRYEVFVSFIGLDEPSMQKIRRWIHKRAVSQLRIAA